jgi:hypothetical protein
MWRRSSGHLLRRGGLHLLIGALIGLLSASIIITSDWAEGRAPDVKFPLLMELTGAYTFLILLPVILAGVRRFPTRANWWHRVPLHVGLSVAVGVNHTLLMGHADGGVLGAGLWHVRLRPHALPPPDGVSEAVPIPTSATSCWTPTRPADAPDAPRSRSTTMICSGVHPSAVARSRRAYCRRVLPMTCRDRAGCSPGFR